MKNQALFSSKAKSKKIQMLPAAIFFSFGSLRDNIHVNYHLHEIHYQ